MYIKDQEVNCYASYIDHLFFALLPKLFAQLLTSSPLFFTESTSGLEITVDASRGNKRLFNYTPASDAYVHIGVITSRSNSATDWKYVRFT